MLGQILDLSPKKIFRWYKEVLSGFCDPIKQKELHQYDTYDQAKTPNKSLKVFVPIFKPQNFTRNMAIDEKKIGEELYTIISSRDTGKIALMISTTKIHIIKNILLKLPCLALDKVKHMTMDLDKGFEILSREVFLGVKIIGDKFHVIRLALEALQAVRIRYRQEALRKERIRRNIHKNNEAQRRDQAKRLGEDFIPRKLAPLKRYENGETILELLARSRYLLFKFKTAWTLSQEQRAQILFREFPEIKEAHRLICSFRSFYNLSFGKEGKKERAQRKLKEWINKTERYEIEEIENFVSTVERNQSKILNYFLEGETNAFAENLNSRLQRFVNINYGIRNLDFFHFRLRNLFS